MISAESHSTETKKIRILVVEDDRMIAQIMEFLVQKVEGEFIRAANGEEGVALALDRNPDLILMDLQMPLMDGIEATRRIRSWEAAKEGRPHFLIYAFTAKNVIGQEDFCLENGFDGLISKPISAGDFLKFISVINKQIKKLSASEGGSHSGN
jgi:CheY-like chemotaxis protein